MSIPDEPGRGRWRYGHLVRRVAWKSYQRGGRLYPVGELKVLLTPLVALGAHDDSSVGRGVTIQVPPPT